MRRRVVVTGLGCVSPVGNSVADSWANLLAGKSGIDLVTSFDTGNLSVKFAGEVKGFNVADYMPEKEARHMDRFIHLGLAAAAQAVQDAGLPTGDRLDPELATRIGVNIGSGIGGLPMIEETHAELMNRGPRRISPFFVPASIINMISGHVSIRYGFQGPNIAIVTACTTGLHAIGVSARLIESGDADVMVAGGAESCVSPLGDVNDTNAIKNTLGEHAKKTVVNSTKSMTGHLLGGAGGIESVFTVLAVHHQKSPPTINIFNQDPECDLDYCANEARDLKIDVALKNNFGFGGTNGTLVFKRI